jgi:hemerythrin
MSSKSNLLTWSSTYYVGVRFIDEQHKFMLAMLNDMYNHVGGDEKAERAYFMDIIDEAVDYVTAHFAAEEKILFATKFPGYLEHKQAHDSFIMTVLENVRDFKAGKKVNFSIFTHFLKDWILSHIAVMDKEYFSLFRKFAAGKVNQKSTAPHQEIAC